MVFVVKPGGLSDRRLAVYTISIQAITATVLSLLTLWIADQGVAIAALTGGWIATVANSYFAIQTFRYTGATAGTKMVYAIYRGEAGKFVIVAVLFVAAFRYMDSAREHGLSLILAFAVVQCTAWFVPFFMRFLR